MYRLWTCIQTAKNEYNYVILDPNNNKIKGQRFCEDPIDTVLEFLHTIIARLNSAGETTRAGILESSYDI